MLTITVVFGAVPWGLRGHAGAAWLRISGLGDRWEATSSALSSMRPDPAIWFRPVAPCSNVPGQRLNSLSMRTGSYNLLWERTVERFFVRVTVGISVVKYRLDDGYNSAGSVRDRAFRGSRFGREVVCQESRHAAGLCNTRLLRLKVSH